MAKDYNTSYILGLIGGILGVITAVVVLAVSGFVASTVSMVNPLLGASGIFSGIFIITGIVGLVLGGLMIFCAYNIKHKSNKPWGLVLLIISIVGLIFGQGIFIGPILGIIGGAKALK